MADTYRCRCGKTGLTGENGAKGHIKFSEGEPHGSHMELPDGWRDLLTVEDESDDEEAVEDGSDDGADEDDQTPAESEESDSGDTRGSQRGGRIRRLLTTPLDELVGGDS